MEVFSRELIWDGTTGVNEREETRQTDRTESEPELKADRCSCRSGVAV